MRVLLKKKSLGIEYYNYFALQFKIGIFIFDRFTILFRIKVLFKIFEYQVYKLYTQSMDNVTIYYNY